MPRRPRIHLDQTPLHIVQRGHNRDPCFSAEENYFTYLHWLGEALREICIRDFSANDSASANRGYLPILKK